jgi:hypothetical protein
MPRLIDNLLNLAISAPRIHLARSIQSLLEYFQYWVHYGYNIVDANQLFLLPSVYLHGFAFPFENQVWFSDEAANR